MSSTRKIQSGYTKSAPTKVSVLLAAFGLGSYKSKSPQECKEVIETANQNVKQSQAILEESERINEAAKQVLTRKS